MFKLHKETLWNSLSSIDKKANTAPRRGNRQQMPKLYQQGVDTAPHRGNRQNV
jgi:hypothetical protein